MGWGVDEDVQVVAEDAEGEDCHGEGVAAVAGVAAEELGDCFVVVFCEVGVLLASYCSLSNPLPGVRNQADSQNRSGINEGAART